MRGDKYQIILILTGIIASLLFTVFFYRELFPEYKKYQQAYVALEEFRSTYTQQSPPAFQYGIKQIVLENKTGGPVEIDRCTSCHVALQFSHFSPTKVAKDANGKIILDAEGIPKKIANEEYVWAKLDKKIAQLTDVESNTRLDQKGKSSEVKKRLTEAESLKSLKTIHVGKHTYDVEKVLVMHPLIGRETRPFEFHPIDEYGCVSCHSGNGRGLTTERAHGPVYDGQYEMEDIGPVPNFTEPDEKNDPKFAKVFNGKPGHKLLFQTTPILVGSLIEAKCVQCHQSSKAALKGALSKVEGTTEKWIEKRERLQKSYTNDLNSLVSFVRLYLSVKKVGAAKTVSIWLSQIDDYRLPQAQRNQLLHQKELLVAMVGGWDGLREQNAQPAKDVAIEKIEELIVQSLGSKRLAEMLMSKVDLEGVDLEQIINQFIMDHDGDQDAKGELFLKAKAVEEHQKATKSVHEVSPLTTEIKVKTDVDRLTKNFHEGEELYISQACYACHRISGFSRGGVGPELTEIGKSYPWYIKQSIVWPQADLKSSTMPNYRLDHHELENLVTFLLAQNGRNKNMSESQYKVDIQRWETGEKTAIEKPLTPAQQHDLRASMTIFAMQGCAACHRLRGFESDVGFAVEKTTANFQTLYREREWFKRTIPEMISGSELTEVLSQEGVEVDKRIVDGIRSNSIIEEIEKQYPGSTESFYPSFKFASRAKNHELKNDPEALKQWKERVERVLKVFVQEYGYGRLIGPRPNWSGVYRTDKWLMEHFYKPSSLIARSIMPVFPFDGTKFYALTYMLDVLGKKNRDADRKVWKERGFSPEAAYELYCSQCHGDMRVGNGPVAEWIYPVPKNLRNADFLRNLTRERVFDSITHGVKGTPMPPWGEAAKDKPTADGIPVLSPAEVEILTDWLYSTLPGGTVIEQTKDVPKWKYQPEDVLDELEREGSKVQSKEKDPLSALPTGENLWAALNPKASSRVEELFNVEKNLEGGPDPYSYYIKKKYYTPTNLAEGQAYFEVNCAVCHGREGDGAGDRASVMLDAKPRMLVNLDWLDTRDDLRLLRSVKYGVSGTSMTPWGDQTTSLQRLQLVMYIRALSQEQKTRDKLFSALYDAFDVAEIVIENARMERFSDIVATQKELNEVTQAESQLRVKAKRGEVSPQEATEAYQKSILLAKQLKEMEKKDQILKDLRITLQKEKSVYERVGVNILSQTLAEQILSFYIKLINLNNDKFKVKNGKLSFQIDQSKEREMKSIYDKIILILNEDLKQLSSEKSYVEGRFASSDRQEQLETLTSKIEGVTKLRNQLITSFEGTRTLRKDEQRLLKEYETKND